MNSNKLLYDGESTWVKLEKDIAVLGITQESAKKVKEFMFIQLPKLNSNIKKGDIYVSLEAIKWSGHLTSPLSGKIIEINEEVYDEPSLINTAPFENWICKIKISDEKEITELKKL